MNFVFTPKPTAIPFTFKMGLKNQEAREGGVVILRCELSRAGVPVQWWKSDDQLYHGGRYQMMLRGKVAEMHIKNIQPEDVGEYSCVFGEQKTTAEVNVRGMCLRTWESVYFLISNVPVLSLIKPTDGTSHPAFSTSRLFLYCW